MSDRVKKYLDTHNMRKVIVDDLVFHINPELISKELMDSLIFIDEMLGEGHVFKDSRTTTAGILEMKNGARYFAKRENNKGVKFTLKYLFRRSRVYRAAYAASRLEELNIPTPKVLVIGSRRKSCKLMSGYLITETVDNALTSKIMCEMLNNDEAFFNDFLRTICKYMTVLHNHGIIHGDMKISNIFCVDSPSGYYFGLWDLDGVIVNNGEATLLHRKAELARVISSYMRTSYELVGISHNIDAMTKIFCDKYNSFSQLPMSPVSVGDYVRSYLKKCKLLKKLSD